MKFTQEQIDFAAMQIGRIDGGERGIFLDTVNTESQIEARVFEDGAMAGVFYSCHMYGGLRMHISFETDTDQFNEELTSCVQSALRHSGMVSGQIWIRNGNRKIIDFLKKRLHVISEGAHDYASMEFIMRRGRLGQRVEQSVLGIRPYEQERIDEYLGMLDGSMTFVDPAPNFLGNKSYFLRFFEERAQANSFEAIWKSDRLVGLYWRKNAEIDLLAVDKEHQRKGHGSILLTRAIDMVFQNTDAPFAYLYAVDWNERGQSFYRSYGMEQSGHSYLLKINNDLREGAQP